jgi:hypothetical protein
MDRIALVIPIHRPVVDPLAPMADGFEHFLRYVVMCWNEIFELQRDNGVFTFFLVLGSTLSAASSKK